MHNLTTPTIKIDDISIRQDADGRYCLNDLHKAAGGENKHRPSLWLENQQVIDLVEELSKAGNPALEQNQPVKSIHGGNKPGTYVVRELVYAYAMWISAAFHLKVIRTFDAVMTGGYQAPAPTFERINSADVAALEAIVQRIKYNFHYQDMAAHAIYSGIRRIYGLKHSVNNLPTCYFHDVLNLLAEVERVSRLFQGMALESEKRFFHRVLRPMLPFNEQEWLHHLDSELSQIEAHHERTLHLITRYQPIN